MFCSYLWALGWHFSDLPQAEIQVGYLTHGGLGNPAARGGVWVGLDTAGDGSAATFLGLHSGETTTAFILRLGAISSLFFCTTQAGVLPSD